MNIKVIVLSLLLLLMLTGCEKNIKDMTVEEIIKEIFEVKTGSSRTKDDITVNLYSEFERSNSFEKTKEAEERFRHHIDKYEEIVDGIWEKEGFYRSEGGLSEKEMLIDFYLFMEYHMDTQKRNLQFPEYVQKDLLLIEALFSKKAIDFISSQDLKEYGVLRDDLVTLYTDMYREELINILYEGHEQIIIHERINNIMSRVDAKLNSSGIMERLKGHLGIPDTVISRGMGLNLVSLYSEMGYLPEGNVKELAIILTMEMRLSGINMRLERFFHVTNSLEGLGNELTELKKDAELIQPQGNLQWVKERMLRSIAYLEDVYLFYKGVRDVDKVEDIFTTLQNREDFYALGMLSSHLKEVMDKEDYWNEVEKIRKMLSENKYVDIDVEAIELK